MSRPVLTHTSEFSVMFPQPGGTQTLTEFDVKWRHWHEEVDRCLQDNSFASNRHLELICKVSEEVHYWRVSANIQQQLGYFFFFLMSPPHFTLDPSGRWRHFAGSQGAAGYLVSLSGHETSLLPPHSETHRVALLCSGIPYSHIIQHFRITAGLVLKSIAFFFKTLSDIL